MKRKRNASKSVDFPRKKRKLGKGKRPPDNATNISFKSRSVVLPSQLEKTKQPTGKRKLTFQVDQSMPELSYSVSGSLCVPLIFLNVDVLTV